jgi:hypothetical protein
MTTPIFTSITVNPNNLAPHALLTEMGYNDKSDIFFAGALKYFNHYECAVIDMDNKVLTHSAEVEAAVANGVTEMTVYRVDLNDLEIRKLIAVKHKYNMKDLLASFNTITFYEDYLKNKTEGIKLSTILTGDINDKIAALIHTSASTVKRLKQVGEKKLHMLGLIQESEKSFKEVLLEIKLERMADNQKAEADKAAKKPEADISVPTVNTGGGEADDEEYYSEPATDQAGMDLYEDDNDSYDDADSSPIDTPPTAYVETATEGNYEFSKGSMTLSGLGDLMIGFTDNIPQLYFNGKLIPNISYEAITNRDSEENGTARSFVFKQPGKKGISIQLTVENLPKAA